MPNMLDKLCVAEVAATTTQSGLSIPRHLTRSRRFPWLKRFRFGAIGTADTGTASNPSVRGIHHFLSKSAFAAHLFGQILPVLNILYTLAEFRKSVIHVGTAAESF